MHAFSRKSRGISLPALVIFLAILAAALGAGVYFLRPKFESEPPTITLGPAADALGAAGVLQIDIADSGTGLKSIRATITAGGNEQTLFSEEFPQPVPGKTVSVPLSKVTGLKEGPAVLRVSAKDASLSNSFKGNEAAAEKQFAIDLTPPTLELVADDRYVNFGGVGAIVYKASADTVTSGVKVGDRFFPDSRGRSSRIPTASSRSSPNRTTCRRRPGPVLVATDKAGNTRQMALAYEIKNVKYKKSTIAISESFLQNKVAPLLVDAAKRQGAPRDVFIAVNKALRKENEDRIAQITKKATPRLLWNGAFGQLTNSKVEANFADQRTYTHNGEAIDTAYHVGYDLSVTKHYPVEAANSGAVVFAGDLGIYGNTVVLDHGIGLFTLYSHLSSIDVKEGDAIKARQTLGKTGETGLAAGDHLHYGVYLDGVAVLPVEWWDAKWIRDNIEPKLEGREEKVAAAAPPPKAARKAAPRAKRK
jgi:murein DD-endopeptidase MepM/ murein hydrolase activator NlpD